MIKVSSLNPRQPPLTAHGDTAVQGLQLKAFADFLEKAEAYSRGDLSPGKAKADVIMAIRQKIIGRKGAFERPKA